MNSKYEKYKESYKKYRENNQEKIKQIKKDWRNENKEYIKIANKNWYNKNKEYIKEHRERYRKENRQHHLALKRAEKERNSWNYIIRGRTYRKYGKARICSRCNSEEKVEHHHFTQPYHEDKFIDLCEKCHKEIGVSGK